MIPAGVFAKWTRLQVLYLLAFAEAPWEGAAVAMEKIRPGKTRQELRVGAHRSHGQYYSAQLSSWRQKPGFRECEDNIRGDPEYAARFIAWLNAPKAAKAVAEAIATGGPSAREKSTDVYRALKQGAAKPVEVDGGAELLEKFLGPRLVKEEKVG